MLLLMNGPRVQNRTVFIRDLFPQQVCLVEDGQTRIAVRCLNAGDAGLGNLVLADTTGSGRRATVTRTNVDRASGVGRAIGHQLASPDRAVEAIVEVNVTRPVEVHSVLVKDGLQVTIRIGRDLVLGLLLLSLPLLLLVAARARRRRWRGRTAVPAMAFVPAPTTMFRPSIFVSKQQTMNIRKHAGNSHPNDHVRAAVGTRTAPTSTMPRR